MEPQELEARIAKLQAGELNEAEEMELLKDIDFSYDVMNKFLELLKIEQLKSELQ